MSSIISAQLTNKDEWSRFGPYLVEQMLTKPGRRLFPQPTYSVSNLDPTKEYTMSLRFDQVGRYKVRFNENKKQWVETVDEAVQEGEATISHKGGPKLGSFWSSNFSFNAKITNYPESATSDLAYLKSQIKYIPVLVVTEVVKDENGDYHTVGLAQTFKFSCTSFVAVTRYFCKEIVDIKVEMNKYAGRDSNKRKRAAVGEKEQNSPKRVCSGEGSPSRENSPDSVILTHQTMTTPPSEIVPSNPPHQLQPQPPAHIPTTNNSASFNFEQNNWNLPMMNFPPFTGNNNFQQYSGPTNNFMQFRQYYPLGQQYNNYMHYGYNHYF